MRSRFYLVLVLVVCCIAGRGAGAATDEVLVIRGGTLIDPARAEVTDRATIVIADGVIRSIGSDPALPSGARVIDATALFVLPGLADMHNHLRPGTFRPGDDALGVLRGLLEWGVTTTFDPGVPEEKFSELRATIGADPAAYPRTFLIKGVFTTEDGWGHGFKPESTDEARAIVRVLKTAGSDGVKLMYDDMSWATTRPFAVMRPDIMAAIIDEAHRQDMLTFAHAPVLEYARQTLEAGIDCLLHGIISAPIDAAFIELMQRNNACYISTLAMFQTNAGYSSWADRLEAFDLEDRLDPKAMALFHKIPTGTARLDNTAWAAARLPVLRANLIEVHQAGIPVVIGTDTGIPGVLPGIATQLEIVLHVEAGLTPMAALEAATGNAARMLRHQGTFGGIREGMAADLLILAADPIQDINNIRRIRYVVRAGKIVSPVGD